MIRTLFFTLLAIPYLSVSAQINGGFEEWSDAGGYEDPDGWVSLNFFTIFGDSASCLKSETSYTGKYSALLRSFISSLGSDTAPAILLQQIPISTKPNSIRFAFQHTNTGSDSGLMSVEFYKGETGNPSNMVGYAEVNLGKNTNWQLVQEDITWTSLEAPDTVVFTIISGFDLGSILKVDDIHLSIYSAGSVVFSNEKIHPVLGAENQIKIFGLQGKSGEIELYEPNGRLVFRGNTDANGYVSNCDIKQGIYLYRLRVEGRGELYSGQVLKR